MAVSQATRTQSRTESMRTRVVALLIALHNVLAGLNPVREEVNPAQAARMGIMDAVKMVGGAVIGIAVVTLVVNEVLTVGAINNTSGPFSGVIDSLETTGVAAMTLLVIGLLVVAASFIMRFMDSF